MPNDMPLSDMPGGKALGIETSQKTCRQTIHSTGLRVKAELYEGWVV
jgi:hypothetical protein